MFLSNNKTPIVRLCHANQISSRAVQNDYRVLKSFGTFVLKITECVVADEWRPSIIDFILERFKQRLKEYTFYKVKNYSILDSTDLTYGMLDPRVHYN